MNHINTDNRDDLLPLFLVAGTFVDTENTWFLQENSKSTNNVKKGEIELVWDEDGEGICMSIQGSLPDCFMATPVLNTDRLAITLPYLNFIIKQVPNDDCAVEFQVRDDQDATYSFIASTNKCFSWSRVCRVPLHLKDGWSKISVDLRQFTRDAFRKNFMYLDYVKITASCRLRSVFCSDKPIPELQLPYAYSLPSLQTAASDDKSNEGGTKKEQMKTQLNLTSHAMAEQVMVMANQKAETIPYLSGKAIMTAWGAMLKESIPILVDQVSSALESNRTKTDDNLISTPACKDGKYVLPSEDHLQSATEVEPDEKFCFLKMEQAYRKDNVKMPKIKSRKDAVYYMLHPKEWDAILNQKMKN